MVLDTERWNTLKHKQIALVTHTWCEAPGRGITSAPGASALCLGINVTVFLALVVWLVTEDELADFPGLLKGFITKNWREKIRILLIH
jgi:hypothetical protein